MHPCRTMNLHTHACHVHPRTILAPEDWMQNLSDVKIFACKIANCYGETAGKSPNHAVWARPGLVSEHYQRGHLSGIERARNTMQQADFSGAIRTVSDLVIQVLYPAKRTKMLELGLCRPMIGIPSLMGASCYRQRHLEAGRALNLGRTNQTKTRSCGLHFEANQGRCLL